MSRSFRLPTRPAWLAKYAGDRKGQVGVIFAVMSIGVMSTMGSSMDAGAIQGAGTKLQDAVDSAALYAVRETAIGSLTDAQAEEAAERFVAATYDSQMNPDLAGLAANRTLTRVVSRSPVEIEVTAERVLELPFGGLTGDPQKVVKRTAKAVEAQETAITLLLLDRTAPAAWRATGTSGLVALDGAAIVNSNSASALSGGGTADIETAGTLVVGPPSAATQWSPRPKFHASPVNDPYKNKIRWPASDGTCTYTNKVVKKVTETLQPGLYCGGLSVTTKGVANLQPGVYVIRGPLEVHAHSTLSAPADVTLVLVGNNAAATFQAGSTVRLKAPDAGDWANIAIAQKPQPTELTSTIIGGAELELDGVLYFPTQKLTVTGGGKADIITGDRILIANRLETSGNGEIYLKGNARVAAVNLGARLSR